MTAQEPGCTHLTFDGIMAGRSFTAAAPAGGKIDVRWFRREADGAIVGRAWFGPASEGPPGHAHGGNISGLLDEAMAIAAWAAGHPVVSARLAVEFRRMVPVGTRARLEAAIVDEAGRKLTVRGRLLAEDGALLAEAEGLFVALPPGRLMPAVTR